MAVGYTNGVIRIYNYLNQALLATLKGHRSMVVSLRFHSDGVTLASGGADCDIVLWDLVSYTATCRLRGHKDSVTGLVFLATPERGTGGQPQYVVSVSKDTLLKVHRERHLTVSPHFSLPSCVSSAQVWDLEAQCCVQTVVGHRCEIWTVAVLQRQAADGTLTTMLLTGASDELIRGYRLSTPAIAAATTQPASTAGEEGDRVILEPYGTLQRQPAGGGSFDKCVLLEFNAAGTLLAAQTSGKMIEVGAGVSVLSAFLGLNAMILLNSVSRYLKSATPPRPKRSASGA